MVIKITKSIIALTYVCIALAECLFFALPVIAIMQIMF